MIAHCNQVRRHQWRIAAAFAMLSDQVGRERQCIAMLRRQVKYLTDDLFLQFSDGVVLHQRASLHIAIGVVEQLRPFLVDDRCTQVTVEWLRVIVSKKGEHMVVHVFLASHITLKLLHLPLFQLAGLIPQSFPYNILRSQIHGVSYHLVLGRKERASGFMF